MRRATALALAAVLVPLLQVTSPAYPGVPPPAIFDAQNPPTLAPIIKRVANAVVSISVRSDGAAEQNSLFDDPLLRQLFGLPDL